MNQTLLDIYRKHLEEKEYKSLNTIAIDTSSVLKRKFEYWKKDSDKIIIEIVDENICFLYKELKLLSDLK